MLGNIHSFQSLGTVDGPGVRFIVFLHGCNLSCGYCHNPDVCQGEFQRYSADEVLARIVRYKDYFGTNGGVTVSGGEPLLQAEFVKELFALCKEQGIHTALDTSGSLWNESIKSLLPLCDLVLLDLKMTTDAAYQQYIGCTLAQPMAFLNELDALKIPCWIRHVVVGGLNDTEENIKALKGLIDGKACVEKVELLPFRKLCEPKYEQMGLPFPFAMYHTPSADTMNKLNQFV